MVDVNGLSLEEAEEWKGRYDAKIEFDSSELMTMKHAALARTAYRLSQNDPVLGSDTGILNVATPDYCVAVTSEHVLGFVFGLEEYAVRLHEYDVIQDPSIVRGRRDNAARLATEILQAHGAYEAFKSAPVLPESFYDDRP